MTMTISLPRVMHVASGRPLSLREHEETFGMTTVGAALLRELDASGLLAAAVRASPRPRKWSSCEVNAAITRSSS